MTRHNLDGQISWLLTREVTFPPTVNAANTSITTVQELADEEPLEEEILDLPRVAPALGTRLQTNVAREFIRPVVPAQKSQPRLDTRTATDEPMGKLASSSKSTRPGLLSQHQLATPASTSGTTFSTGSTSRTGSRPGGLTGNYVAQLAEERGQSRSHHYSKLPLTSTGTPSARGTAARARSQFPRTFEAPQTPRQTPRPTVEPKIEHVDSIDLTGDENSADGVARSSSSEVVFGQPTLLWTEDAAARAEPPIPETQPRSSKKRKSGDLSPDRPRRTAKHGSQRTKTSQSQTRNLDDFPDIEDVLSRSHAKTPSSPIKHKKSLQPTVESEHELSNMQEYHITETISTIRTQTRQSISRAPSFSNTPQLSRQPTAQLASRRSTASTETIEPFMATVQVAASPVAEHSKSPREKHTSTPQRSVNRRLQRTIQDSDEEEDLSEVEKRASCSPCTPVKPSPRIVKTSASPSRHNVSIFSPSKRKGLGESQPRVGSPLRPISQNRQTPDSSLRIDDKKLVAAYMKNPSSLGLYKQRHLRTMRKTSDDIMYYMDQDQTAPENFKEARKLALDQNKAFTALEECQERHKNLMDRKFKLAGQVLELLGTGTDVSDLENQQAVYTLELRKLEKEAFLLLTKSGAINAGFGMVQENEKVLAPIESSNQSGAVSASSGTSTNPQIILQTQLPSAQSRIAASHDDHIPQGSFTRSSSNFGDVDNTSFAGPIDSSSKRMNETTQYHEPTSRLQASPSRGPSKTVPKQPNFYREPSPSDYDFDGEEFQDLLEFEQEIQTRAPKTPQRPIQGLETFEDDFSSQYDEELLEAAENFDQHQNLPKPAVPSQRAVATHAPQRITADDYERQNTEQNMYSNIDPEESNLFGHAWSNDVKKALKDRFKLNGFRKHQLEAMNATLKGDDVFVLMPTGGGKSLCFQLPAVVQSGKTKGVTIVISPLLSLMQDQVDHLTKLNIRAARISSDTPAADKRMIMKYLNEAHPEQFIQLLYVSPEMINLNQAFVSTLERVHRNKKLARFVIDEAHCVSHWGHDFRPDYVELKNLRGNFPNVPVIALTATATETVRQDVKESLGMGDCLTLAQSFNRPNLHYEVRKKITKNKNAKTLDSVDEFAEMIKIQYKNQSGIIYSLSQKSCEDMAKRLQDEYGIKAEAYHASIAPEKKAEVQKAWQSGEVQVVVATIAFGMGIDKKDVRFIIHWVIPKSLEGYYQETGRAGRDGKRSGCYLYYSGGDTGMIYNMIFGNKGEVGQEVVNRQKNMFKRMQLFCDNRVDCRRVQILSYFGETFTKAQCHRTCDNCNDRTKYRTVDYSLMAKLCLSIVVQVQSSNHTLLHCVEILRGTNTKKIRDLRHNELKEYGAGKDLDKVVIERIFEALKREEAVREENVANKGGFSHNYIKLGSNSRAFFEGREKLRLQVHDDSSTGVAKQRNEPYPSTAVTSPLTPSSRKTQRIGYGQEESDDDEADAFEPVKPSRRKKSKAPQFFGPRITSDERMAELPEPHQAVIHQFVEEAKKLEEKIRNKNSLKRALFTETNLREMAIQGPASLDEMCAIPDINVNAVKRHGTQFLTLVQTFLNRFMEMMDPDNDRDMDANHQNVIDLITDGEEEEDDEDDDEEEAEEEYAMREGIEDAIADAERISRHFEPKGKGKAGGRFGKGGYKAKKGKKYVGRKSNSSASGQSNAGVKKRASSGSSRSRGGGGRGSRGNTFANSSFANSSLARSFSNHGGGGGSGGGGGGVRPMPA